MHNQIFCSHCKNECAFHLSPWESTNRMSGYDPLSSCCDEPIVYESGERVSEEEAREILRQETIAAYVPD